MKQSLLDNIQFYLSQAAEVIDKTDIYSYVAKAIEKWEIFEEYVQTYWSNYRAELQTVFGVFLIFYGGNIAYTLMAFEAFCVIGFEQTKQNLKNFYQSFLVARNNLTKDDPTPATSEARSNGERQLCSKTKAFLKSIDPEKLSQATQGLLAGIVTVIATLQSSLARSITLGMALSNLLLERSTNYLIPKMQEFISPEFHKWVLPTISFIAKLLGFVIAYYAQVWLNVYAGCVYGVELILCSLCERNYLTPERYSYLISIAPAIACIGLVKQLNLGWTLSWVLLLPFSPFMLVEWLLQNVAVL